MEQCKEDDVDDEAKEQLEPIFKLLRMMYRDTDNVQMRMNELGYGMR